MVLHIFVIYMANFEENGSIFEVIMNRKTFFIVEEGGGGIRINLKMMSHGWA